MRILKRRSTIYKKYIFPAIGGMIGTSLYVLGDTILVGRRLGAIGLAQVVGLLILSTHFFRSKFNFIKINSIKGLFEIISNGGASFVLELSQGIVIFAFNFAFIKLAGDLAVSVYGIVANLSLLFTAILIGVANGIQPLISKAYGKRRSDMKVYYAKIAAFGAVVAGLLITTIRLLMPEYLAMAFVANEPEIIKNAAYGIRLYFLAFPLLGVNLVITIYLQSQKQTTKAFIFSLLRGLILIIILLLILTPTLKIPGVWLVMPIAEVIALGVGLILVRNKKTLTR